MVSRVSSQSLRCKAPPNIALLKLRYIPQLGAYPHLQ